MSWYRHRVERDLARWQNAGWVSEAGADVGSAMDSARTLVIAPPSRTSQTPQMLAVSLESS